MPKAQANKNRSAKRSGKNNLSGRRPGELPGNGLHGRSRGPRALAAAEGSFGAHLLNKPLVEISVFEVDDSCMFDESDYGMNYRRETNSRADDVPHAVTLLYKCLRRHPRFKDDKEWPELPSMAELQDYLFKQVRKLCPAGHNWAFTENSQGFARLIFYKEITDQTHVVPLDWIEEFREENPPLYELIRVMVCKVAMNWGMNFIENPYNENIINEPSEYVMWVGDQDMDAAAIFMRDVKIYQQGGIAYDWMARQAAYGNRYNVAELEKMILRLFRKTKNPIHRAVLNWLQLGIDCLRAKGKASVADYYYTDFHDMNDGEPINPFDIFEFLWTFTDKVFDLHEQSIEQTSQQGDVIGPMLYLELFPDKTEKSPDEHPIKSLARFMNAGRKIYMQNYYDDFVHRREESESANNIDHELLEEMN